MSDLEIRIGPGVPDPEMPQPGIQPEAGPQANRRIHPLAIATVALVVGLVLGGGATAAFLAPRSDDQQARPAAATSPAATRAAAAEPVKPTYYQPVKTDFGLSVKILKKSCFGSAGCNVNYRIELKSLGTFVLDPTKDYELVYEIHGGEEAQINTLTITGENYRVDDEESIQTKSSKSELTVTVVEISEH